MERITLDGRVLKCTFTDAKGNEIKKPEAKILALYLLDYSRLEQHKEQLELQNEYLEQSIKSIKDELWQKEKELEAIELEKTGLEINVSKAKLEAEELSKSLDEQVIKFTLLQDENQELSDVNQKVLDVVTPNQNAMTLAIVALMIISTLLGLVIGVQF